MNHSQDSSHLTPPGRTLGWSKFISCTLASILISGCCLFQGHQWEEEIRGSIVSGRYEHPDGLFTFLLPMVSKDTGTVFESFGEDWGAITIERRGHQPWNHRDLWNTHRIGGFQPSTAWYPWRLEYFPVVETSNFRALQQGKRDQAPDCLREYLLEVQQGDRAPAAYAPPRTMQLYGEPAHFLVLKLPEAMEGSISGAHANKQPDVEVSVLQFVRGDHFFMISTEAPLDDPLDPSKVDERMAVLVEMADRLEIP